MSKKFDDLSNEYKKLIRNVRPRELAVKLNNCVSSLLAEAVEEAGREMAIRAGSENALSALLKGIKTDG